MTSGSPSGGTMFGKGNGFSLIELLVTIVVLSIVAAFAIPGFANLIGSTQLTSGTNSVVSSIRLARSEAVKRGDEVTWSTDAGMASGWCVHIGGATNDCSNPIRAFSGPDNLIYNPSANDLVFDHRGFLTPQSAQTITLRPQDCASGDDRFRTIRISPVGRTMIDDTGVCP
ncbi:pilus assembly protein [Tamilnaduibacter salinus]|uniref:Type II secretion system protein H n=1 Tax=Tamilnaduibacter salinus TaxID=1484056 RepID=A0A2A2HYZ1_9GAMM|nr:pilus assembly protein [Tamilnaduibacter salinus]